VTDTTSPGTQWPTWEHARSVVEQPWWGYRGLWGDQQDLPGSQGPRGPHPDRQEAVFATKACALPTESPEFPEVSVTPESSTPQAEPEPGTIPDAFRDTWEAAKPTSRPGLAQPYYVHLQLFHEDTPDTEGRAGSPDTATGPTSAPPRARASCSVPATSTS
jgi:hypothetical protein